MKGILFATIFLLLLTGCEERQVPVPPAPTPPTQAATPTPTEAVVNYDELYQKEGVVATVEGFYHRPFEELPQELRDSLTWDGEVRTLEGYGFRHRLRHYIGPNIVVVTTEATEDALQDWLDWQLSVPVEERETPVTDEELRAEYELEKGREWLYSVTITDDSYATLLGLKVGNTVEEAEALGYVYPLGQQLTENGCSSFGNGWEHSIDIYTEDGVVTKLEVSWGLHRYTGKYWDL